MAEKMNLIEWLNKWDQGGFTKDVDSMIDAGWWDWFCQDSSLYNRTKKMIGIIRAAASSPLLDPKKTYVFFKNNAPLSGGTYDSVSFSDIETKEQIYWVSTKNKHSGQAEIFKAPNWEDDQQLLPKGANVNDIKKFFKNGGVK